MADYEMEPYAYELNNTGAKLARETCDEVTAKNPSKPRFKLERVVQQIGSISPSVEDPAARKVNFDELVEKCVLNKLEVWLMEIAAV
eukprot:CAMPEP_0171294868 /NCGR_PEP_ID=MMETSP0816-20121228/3366_1 /TAXON_ID=420281 /ORGANISM="Proboscia inermis, Strain CCAP1064/1" /LENGTH=86 /DNA_ID=CAMNT_0011767019 /DNA_START=299 /DNA_END=560 /DNA_ORIENTATION=-